MIKKGKRVSASQSLWVVHRQKGSSVAVLEFGTITKVDRFTPQSHFSSKTIRRITIKTATSEFTTNERTVFRVLNKPSRSYFSPGYYTNRKLALKCLEIFNNPTRIASRDKARKAWADMMARGVQIGISDLVFKQDEIIEENETRFNLKRDEQGNTHFEKA